MAVPRDINIIIGTSNRTLTRSRRRTTHATNFFVVFLFCFIILERTASEYVDGVEMRTFRKGEDIPLKVNALTSFHTLISRDYYRLPFCHPERVARMDRFNLGQEMTGNKIQNSPYVIKMLQEVRCRKLCQWQLNSYEAAILQRFIQQGYHNNWIVDGLPSANMAVSGQITQKHYGGGFPIGIMYRIMGSEKAYVYNHVNIHLDYFATDVGYRIVGFAVEPLSVKHRFPDGFEWDGLSIENFQKPLETCPDPQSGEHMTREVVEQLQVVRPGEKVLFTYDVMWNQSGVSWSSRWDVYLTEDHLVPPQVHSYSIVNSTAVVLFLSMMVTCILIRNLRKDVAATRGRSAPSEQDAGQMEDEKGWKALHGDVFRPPQEKPMLFYVLVGTGIHLAVTAFIVISLAMFGWLSPAHRGSIMNTILFVYLLSSPVNGYSSGLLYNTIGGRDEKKCWQLSASLFPGVSFGLFVLNLIIGLVHSSGITPITAIFLLPCVWCLHVPMVLWGFQSGYRNTKALEFPTTTFDAPRPIPPPSRLWKNPLLSMVLAGLLPFSAAYVELFFILTSLWMDQYYYVYGFAFIVYLIMLITCSEVTILCVYYRLNSENHRWWWQAFFWGGSMAFHIFMYGIVWFRSLEANGGISTYIIYFGYMLLLCFAVFLASGSVAFVSSLLFVRMMYSAINQAEVGYVELLDTEDNDDGMPTGEKNALALVEQGGHGKETTEATE